ncbi:aminoglycoside adenylyltransferase domain-containing protein [Paenibacillus cremeus]|nr:aminoglycoside adenylyltransferase domain-containing protein [Paenibacillus cremeus]
MGKGQGWVSCDEDIKQYVEQLVQQLKTILGDQLKGVYLHGSLAMGSYYCPKSDIDLIVVVAGKLDAERAKTVGVSIANQAADRPTTGNVELSVITGEVARTVPAPTPFEVHYSSEWHEKILQDEIFYSQEKIDADLPTHLTYVTQRGICLYGEPIADIFGHVKWECFLASVMDDLKWIVQDEHIVETPFYSVLNICRVFQLVRENNQQVHSKDEGGEWGLEHLPHEFHPLIQRALDIYRSSENVHAEQRRTGGKEWDKAALLAFRDYARVQLKDFI